MTFWPDKTGVPGDMGQRAGQDRSADSSQPLVLAAMAMFAAVAVLGVLLRPTLPIDETRYLTVAWEMRTGGNWLVPHLNGALYSHKPPLLFWLINLVWLLVGPSETAARLIGPAFGLAGIWATARLARRLYPDQPQIGGRAALALAGAMGFVLFAGLTMFDAMLTLATVLGVLALTHVPDRGWKAWCGFGAALALGALSKGPVVLIHLLPVALTLPLWMAQRPAQAAAGGRGRIWRQTLAGLGLALLVGLALVGLWLVPALLAGGDDYRRAVLWTQSAGRMVDSFAHQQPFWFYLLVLPFMTWPWSWSPAVWRAARFPGPLPVWIGVPVLAFSLISGKQAHYLLPEMPALALAAAPALIGMGARIRWAALLPGAFALLLGAVMLGLGPHSWRVAADPMAPAALAAVLALISAALVWTGGMTAAASTVLMLAISTLFLGRMGEEYDAGPIARRLAPHEVSGVGVVAGGYAGEFGFAGRMTRPVTVFDTSDAGFAWLAQCPGRVLLSRTGNIPEAGLDASVVSTAAIPFRGARMELWVEPADPAPDPAGPSPTSSFADHAKPEGSCP